MAWTSMVKVESVWDLSDSKPFIHRCRDQPFEGAEVLDVVFGQLCWREELVVLEHEDVLSRTLCSSWSWVLLEHILKCSL